MSRWERALVKAFFWVEDRSRPILTVALVVAFLGLIWAVRL